MNDSPSSVRSCWRLIAGDASFVSPSFLTTTASCSSCAGKRGAISVRVGRRRHLARHLHERPARRERPLHEHVSARHRRLRRRSLQQRRAERFLRHVEGERLRRVHRAAARVLNVEQIVNLQRLVTRLDDDARLAADRDGAGDRRLGRRGFVRCDEHQANAALSGERKLLRLKVLAVDVGARRHGCAGGDALELRAAVLVGFHGQRLAAALHFHRLPDQVVRELSADHADGHRAGRQIVDGARNARHLLRIGHLELGEQRRDQQDEGCSNDPSPPQRTRGTRRAK